MYQYIIELIKGERKGATATLVRFFLFLLSGLYYLAVVTRQWFYKVHIFRSYWLPCPVICVGNITVGGTGKTPAVITLAKILAAEGQKVAILSRGYKRKSNTKTGIVGDGNKILLNPEEAGDEPYLLAQNLPGVGVVVGKDRVETGKIGIEQLGARLIVLDDGYQHFRLRRNLDVVVIDCLEPFGKKYLLPRGFLREPLKNLDRADVFLLTRTDQVSKEELKSIKESLTRINPKTLLIESLQEFYRLERLNSSSHITPEPISLLKDRAVVALSSIGNPVSFEKTLESMGAKIVEKLHFPDHYQYTKEMLAGVFQKAVNNIIVTTEKDAVRIRGKLVGLGDILVLGVSLQIIKGYEEFRTLLKIKIGSHLR
jgi:tetraacyldisaccharide 4'-kinase